MFYEDAYDFHQHFLTISSLEHKLIPSVKTVAVFYKMSSPLREAFTKVQFEIDETKFMFYFLSFFSLT